MPGNDVIATRYVQIAPTTEGIKGELTDLMSEEGSSAGESFSSGFMGVIGGLSSAAGPVGVALTALTGVFAGAATGVADAVSGAATSLVEGVSEIASYGDDIDKMSQKMGISAEAYQEWEAVMQHSGTSMETMKAGMKTLANAVESGNQAFERIGITEEQLAQLNNEDLFGAVIAGLQQVDNETERTYLAGQLLGRGATELGALLNTSAEDTQAMKDRVRELGGVMGADAVKDAAAFQDSLQDLTTGIDGIGRNLLSSFLPSMTQVMDGLTDIFAGDYSQGVDGVKAGIESVIAELNNLIPKFTEVAVPLLEALGDALLSNIPIMLPAIGDLVTQLATSVIQYLPKLAELGVDIITSLADGISKAIPQITAVLPGVIQTISDTLVQNAPQLMEAGAIIINAVCDSIAEMYPVLIPIVYDAIEQIAQFMVTDGLVILIDVLAHMLQAIVAYLISYEATLFNTGMDLVNYLANAFVQGVVIVIAAVVKMMTAVGNKIKECAKEAVTWGTDLVKNFINGIKSRFGDLKGVLKELAGLVADLIGFSEPKEGPLSNFHTYAPDMMELFAKGIKDNESVISTQIKKSFDFEADIRNSMPQADTFDVSPMYSMDATSLMPEDNSDLSGQFAQAVTLLGQLVDKDPVEIGANAAGIFDLVRKQNNMYLRANGRGALA